MNPSLFRSILKLITAPLPEYQIRQYITLSPEDFDNTCKEFHMLIGFSTASYVDADGTVVFVMKYL